MGGTAVHIAATARRSLAAGGLCALVLVLAACAGGPRPGPGPGPRGPAEPPPARTLISVADLPGWEAEDHLAAFQAYARTCDRDRSAPARTLCAEARRSPAATGPEARRFFETRFLAEPVAGEGMLTAYFAPEYEARTEPDEIFSASVKARPEGLTRGPDGKYPPGPTRAEIEREAGGALAFMRPEDLFFMQIQGSGYLDFPEGRRVRAAYAADNGQPFVGIARPMTQQGLLPANGTSGEAIRAWLADHRGAEAAAITDLNPRYVFFALEPDDNGEPRGAAGVPLPAGRAVAVDGAEHAWGELLWIDADAGTLAGGARIYRRLVTALDAGGAIKGRVRADLYLGRGEAAGAEAGRVKHRLRLFRLIPRA